jgi:hypothetical protein
MHKQEKIYSAPAAFGRLVYLITGKFPTAMLAFGVLANFAWLAVAFWVLSYWLAWHWA